MKRMGAVIQGRLFDESERNTPEAMPAELRIR
jgi:hypothetical protein